jgi:hypothetical protein
MSRSYTSSPPSAYFVQNKYVPNTNFRKSKMFRACDENARREMASHNSLMDLTGKKDEGTT